MRYTYSYKLGNILRFSSINVLKFMRTNNIYYNIQYAIGYISNFGRGDMLEYLQSLI
jgi:hypothetical protein